jgi:hypothetical protein
MDRVQGCALASPASVKGRELLHRLKYCQLLKDSAAGS